MKKYYTVVTNTWKEITIDETELHKALWSFTKDTGAIFNDGACQKILSITPDRVASMGWNKGYKPTPEENKEITQKLGRNLENYLSEMKELVYLSTDIKTLESNLKQNLWNTKTLLLSLPKSLSLSEKNLQLL